MPLWSLSCLGHALSGVAPPWLMRPSAIWGKERVTGLPLHLCPGLILSTSQQYFLAKLRLCSRRLSLNGCLRFPGRSYTWFSPPAAGVLAVSSPSWGSIICEGLKASPWPRKGKRSLKNQKAPPTPIHITCGEVLESPLPPSASTASQGWVPLREEGPTYYSLNRIPQPGFPQSYWQPHQWQLMFEAI